MYYSSCYDSYVSVMTFRVDDEVDQAIDYLTRCTGQSKSKVVRDAVLSAERQARREAMLQEALTLSGDAADRVESADVLAFMGGYDAW